MQITNKLTSHPDTAGWCDRRVSHATQDCKMNGLSEWGSTIIAARSCSHSKHGYAKLARCVGVAAIHKSSDVGVLGWID
jgi:hypothetical protein